MKLPVLTPEQMPELAELHLQNATPLWYYILKEAEVLESGEHLGPVGGRIVSEVFVGLLQGDKQSYLSQDPEWRPTLPTWKNAHPGQFTMVDLLSLADPNAHDKTVN